MLTGFFVLLETSFFIQCNKNYLGDFSFVSHQVHIPLTVLPGIFYFIFSQISLHLTYCFIVWMVALSISHLFSFNNNKMIWTGMTIWTFGVITALTANQVLFPNSKFAELSRLILPNETLAKLLLSLFLIIGGGLLILSFIALIKVIVQRKLYWISIICLGIFLCFTQVLMPFKGMQTTSISTAEDSFKEKPNIILIGVDSLRPDFLGYFGHDIDTPFFDDFLSHSTVFAEATTPLARTFPSWASLLTGLYPRELGVRFNLARQDKLDLSETLPAILKQHGYETIYATDETRFSNIGKNFGFDLLITPPSGLNDFLIGTFNDFPFSNLIVNTVLGKWLFPYSYANRAVFFTYDPNTFLSLFHTNLPKERKIPLFIAAHFCLTHTPYLWSNLRAGKLNIWERYVLSIRRADQQLKEFFTLLKDEHILDHAIVVLLSDHGEALELSGDRITEQDLFVSSKRTPTLPRFYPPSLDQEDINQSIGHGGDVLSLTQYRVLLGVRFYGPEKNQERLITGVVSLLDIKPTLLDLLHVPYKATGLSLAKIIKGEQKTLPVRHIFLESDYTPEAIRTVYPETRRVMLEGMQIFEIDPLTTRLIVKETMSQMIIRSKQYADIYGEWILALYPQNTKSRMPVLVNLITGEWTCDLNSPLALNSKAHFMLKQLKTFYGDEIGEVD
jgi:arylsulfatase A-like enzyme